MNQIGTQNLLIQKRREITLSRDLPVETHDDLTVCGKMINETNLFSARDNERDVLVWMYVITSFFIEAYVNILKRDYIEFT